MVEQQMSLPQLLKGVQGTFQLLTWEGHHDSFEQGGSKSQHVQ